LTSKYIYKGMDLTLDIYEKLRHVVELIAAQNKISFDEAYMLFAKSHTYWCLTTPATAMWGESDEFIVDEFYRENQQLEN
jgi:hypothetical protein